jgi:mannose-6-phosphate isomerase-like protein (cupin superfamily)
MVKLIESPTVIQAEGNKPKEIREFIGRVNSSTEELSIAHMISPEGWLEPGQTPDFNEYTVVLKGTLKVETGHEVFMVEAGKAIMISRGEWVRYSSPEKGGAEYIAVCLPAFSPDSVHRD